MKIDRIDLFHVAMPLIYPWRTAYGEDGYTGHRLGHSVVWTVPYAEFLLPRVGS